MTQVRKNRAAHAAARSSKPRRALSPRQAASCGGPADDLLDPEWFKALCDPTRTLIFGCLMKCSRPCTVGEIAECCAVDLSVVSRHLQVLERAGMLKSQRSGRSVAYAVQYGDLCRILRQLADAIDQCCPAGSPRAKGACHGMC